MLYLNARFNRAIRDLLRPTYTNWNYDIYAHQPRFNGTYIRRLNVEQAMLPYAINGIEVVNTTFIISDNEGHTIADTAIKIKNLMDRADESEYHLVCRVLTNDIDAAVAAMTYLSDPLDGVQDIYTKCAEQTTLRAGSNNTTNIRYVCKVKNNHAVIFCNYEDVVQASDIYLTIGILPILFTDIKEKFNEDELNYCKELVHRSQLKRITNITVCTLFNKLSLTRKYNDIASEQILTATVAKVIESKIQAAKNEVSASCSAMEQSLESYQNARTKYLRASKLLSDTEQSKKDLKEELGLALKLDTIKQVNVSRDTLDIIFCTPAKFFDTDEAECAIRRIDNGFVKQFITDIFIERKFKLYISAVFRYTLADTTGWQGVRQMGIDEQCISGGLANPHMQYYSCVGDYRMELIKAQTDKNLLVYNSIASASTSSINFKDGTVMNRWFETLDYMFNNWTRDYTSSELMQNVQCLETEDGNRYSIHDIYIKKILENKEAEIAEATDIEVVEL